MAAIGPKNNASGIVSYKTAASPLDIARLISSSVCAPSNKRLVSPPNTPGTIAPSGAETLAAVGKRRKPRPLVATPVNIAGSIFSIEPCNPVHSSAVKPGIILGLAACVGVSAACCS